MNQQDNSGNAIMANSTLKSKAAAILANPTVRLAGTVAAEISFVVLGAFYGYRFGKKSGLNSGSKMGYGKAMNDLGINAADVPELASAWAEGKAAREQAMAKAAVPA
jgi:hypothetical protein